MKYYYKFKYNLFRFLFEEIGIQSAFGPMLSAKFQYGKVSK